MSKIDVTCPDCGGRMVLRNSKFGPFYGCENYPKCKATHGAHPDGRPLGIPANKETKQWRMKAHDVFDKLWKGRNASMTRKQAYKWFQENMGLTAGEAHIGKFNIKQCQALIALISKELAKQPPQERKR